MAIRLLALDLDDTLLRSDLSISNGNRAILAEAERQGVIIVLASGRAPEAMLPYVRELGLDKQEGYVICYNGASLRRTDTGHEEWGVRIGNDIAAEIWDLCAEKDWPVQTYLDGTILVNDVNDNTSLDSKLTGFPLRKVSREEFLAANPVKLIVPHEPVGLTPIEKEIRERFRERTNIFRSKPYFLEIMHAAADKGLALRRLASMHGIDREEVMAMGDAMNDEGMLRWAGLPVAMANALPAIKSIARWVTTRNHQDDGVAEAVQRFVLTRQ